MRFIRRRYWRIALVCQALLPLLSSQPPQSHHRIDWVGCILMQHPDSLLNPKPRQRLSTTILLNRLGWRYMAVVSWRRRTSAVRVVCCTFNCKTSKIPRFPSILLIAKSCTLSIYNYDMSRKSRTPGLRALEQHGLEYSQLHNLAGVSAGSVVVAMIAIGYRADELFDLVQVSKICKRI